MKKILAAVLVGSAFVLTACGGSDEPTPRETVYVQEDEQDNEGGSDGEGQSAATEQQFLSRVADHMTPALHDVAQSDVVALGYAYCDDLDHGRSIEGVLNDVISAGVTPTDAGVILGAAVRFFCPEHEDEALDFIESNGGTTT